MQFFIRGVRIFGLGGLVAKYEPPNAYAEHEMIGCLVLITLITAYNRIICYIVGCFVLMGRSLLHAPHTER
jgi:hypothetical protein